MKVVVICAIATGAVSIFAIAFALSGKAKAPPSSGSTEQVERAVPEKIADSVTSQQLANLQREVAQLKAGQVARGPQASAAADTQQAPLTPEERKEVEQRGLREYKERLEGVMHNQYRDARWAGDTERKVESVLVGYAGNTLDSVTCATNLCRLVVKHDDGVARKAFLQTIGQAEPFMPGTFYSYDGMTTTMYFVKDGERLPNPAN